MGYNLEMIIPLALTSRQLKEVGGLNMGNYQLV